MLGVVAVVVVLLGLGVVVVALAFSVTVQGSSMRPTFATGDRLLVDPFGGEVKRFDIVESTLGDREIPVVKRVIGMPGDEVQASIDADGEARVLVRPAGSDQVFRVDSPTWPGRVGVKSEPCCVDDGTVLGRGQPARWVTVPAEHYWLIGDNWGGSDDSRAFGFVAADQVLARVLWRLEPLSEFGRLGDRPRLVPVDAAG